MSTRQVGPGPKVEALRSIAAFQSLALPDLEFVASLLDEVDIEAGRELMHEGERSREFLFVVEGSVEVSRDGVTIGLVGPGEVLGEMGVLSGDRRNATAVALTPLHAFVGPARMMQVIRGEVAVAEILDRTIAERGPHEPMA